MKRRHPWAALQDFVGNLWCATKHHSAEQWEYKYPGYISNVGPSVSDLMRSQIVCRCCGRHWTETGGKFVALTHTHLDAAGAQDVC